MQLCHGANMRRHRVLDTSLDNLTVWELLGHGHRYANITVNMMGRGSGGGRGGRRRGG